MMDKVTSPPRMTRGVGTGAVGKRSVTSGLGSGLLGSFCCVAGGITTAAGLGAAGFFATLMDHYQPYFIIASVLVMATMLIRSARRLPGGWRDRRALARMLRRNALAMGVVYLATLGASLALFAILGAGTMG